LAIDPTAKVEADPKTKLVNIETQQSEAAVKRSRQLDILLLVIYCPKRGE